MFRIEFDRGTSEEFIAFVQDVSKRINGLDDCTILFHLFNDTADRGITNAAVSEIKQILPEALCVGCSTSGNICDGEFVKGEPPTLSAFCDVYVSPTTQIEVHQFPLTEETWQDTVRSFQELISQRPWVNAVELLTTIIDVDMPDVCKALSEIREDIEVFGGAALCTETMNMHTGLPYVFTLDGTASGHSAIFALYGGEDLHFETQAIVGWQPLGKNLAITRADGSVIYELDGKPAYDLYKHYLNIENDEVFSDNSLIFPFFINHDGYHTIKAPVKVNDDNSLSLTSILGSDDKMCRLSYGDPGVILKSISESAETIRAFAPQALFAFSCAGRFTYWGDEFISRETMPFQSIAPASGFYTGGEFSRHDGKVLHHNLTLVIAGVREGDTPLESSTEVGFDKTEFSREMAIVSTLAHLVGVTSSELEDAYNHMELLAKTDGLTRVFNRKEIESRISEAIAASQGVEIDDEDGRAPCIIMVDLDDFKRVNDAYGHKAGDDVLKKMGEILKSNVDNTGKGTSGRWGGEEFMALLPNATIKEAKDVAESMRNELLNETFALSGRQTLSAGIARALPNEITDLLCQRADKALYAAKKKGKNCIVVA